MDRQINRYDNKDDKQINRYIDRKKERQIDIYIQLDGQIDK